MGLFDKDAGAVAKERDKQKKHREKFSDRKNEKAQKELTQKGVDLTGILILDKDVDREKTSYLLVFPDRVEHRFRGMVRWSEEVIPISQITSISTYKAFLSLKTLVITAANQSIEHPCTPYDAENLKSKILELKNSPQTSSTDSNQSDPTELLEKLANLHKSGILTDEEFAEKKTALLKRI